MKENIRIKPTGQQRIPSLKRFPLISVIQQLHTHNLRVAQVCRENSMHSVQQYETNKDHYQHQKLPDHQSHIKNALDMEKEKKENVQDRNKSAQKRNSDNIRKLQRALVERRQNIQAKEIKMMQKSLVRRQEYLKSLNDSFHRSQDKLYKIRQREENEMAMSNSLYSSYQEKVEAAQQRKEEYVEEAKFALRQKNKLIASTQEFCYRNKKKKQDVFIKRLVNKFEQAEAGQLRKASKIENWLQEKRKDEEKLKEKYLKKRAMLQEDKDRYREQEKQKSDQKMEKAFLNKRMMLTSITNTIQAKRKNKEKDVLNATMTNLKKQEQRIEGLNQKYMLTTSLWSAYKQQKEWLHGQNLADSYMAVHCE